MVHGGGTLIHALEKRLREREREREKEGESHSGGARPPNLLNIAFNGLASLTLLLVPRRLCPRSKHPCSLHVHAKKKEISQLSRPKPNYKDRYVTTATRL